MPHFFSDFSRLLPRRPHMHEQVLNEVHPIRASTETLPERAECFLNSALFLVLFFLCTTCFPRCKIGGFKKAIISLCYCACRSCFPSMLFYLAKLEDFSGWQTWCYERNALLLQFGLCKTHTYIIDYKYYAWTLLKCHYKAIGKYFTFTENRNSTTAIAKSPIKRDFSVCTMFRAI